MLAKGVLGSHWLLLLANAVLNVQVNNLFLLQPRRMTAIQIVVSRITDQFAPNKRHIRVCIFLQTSAYLIHCRVTVVWSGAQFTNDFRLTIQIWLKYHLAVIPLLAIGLQPIFAHAAAALLSCHVPCCSNHMVGIEVRAEWNFYRIWIVMSPCGAGSGRANELQGQWPRIHKFCTILWWFVFGAVVAVLCRLMWLIWPWAKFCSDHLLNFWFRAKCFH